MYDWVADYEKRFDINKLCESMPYLVIEGECKYLQSLNNISLAVLTDVLPPLNVYSRFNEVAFLVRDWIKVQDSLEMLFNLLTGSSDKSLEVISYLRIEKISPIEFATYLYISRKIILVNRFTGPSSNKDKRDSQLMIIKSVVDSFSSGCYYLVVGDRGYKRIKSWNNVLDCRVIVHPSGVVLTGKRDSHTFAH